MLPLMNYSTNNIPQYQQPIYQNPYMDRMQNLQSYQQPLQPQMQMQGLNGRIVDDFGNITANDVPMDNMGCAKGIAAVIMNNQLQLQLTENTKKSNYTNAGEIEKIYKMIER